MDADNQQERLDANWVVGFADGEGCFYVGINHPRGYTQVLPEFRIVQHQRDVKVLHRLQNFFGFGTVTKNHGTRMELRIRGTKNLSKLVEFFRKHPLRTVKRQSFNDFATVVEMINSGKSKTLNGLRQIQVLSKQMNRHGLESSETVRQTRKEKIQSDLISDDEMLPEMAARLI